MGLLIEWESLLSKYNSAKTLEQRTKTIQIKYKSVCVCGCVCMWVCVTLALKPSIPYLRLVIVTISHISTIMCGLIVPTQIKNRHHQFPVISLLTTKVVVVIAILSYASVFALLIFQILFDERIKKIYLNVNKIVTDCVCNSGY